MSEARTEDALPPGLTRLRPPPSLPTEFAKLIQTLWTSSLNDVVSPSEFKTQIQRYAPRFMGYK